MAKLQIRIKGGKVEHHAEGFSGRDCQQVGEEYLRRFNMGLSDTGEEPMEVEEQNEAYEG